MTDCILNINKPQGFTSHDVVAKLRGILKTKKIGHCGTLDPMATGVLPVCVGKATKAVEFIMGQDKEYIATFKLGIISDTQDITGKLVFVEHKKVNQTEVESVLNDFLGQISQIPPMYSAIKKDGVKLYKFARKGIEIEREPRDIFIRYLKLLSFDLENEEYKICVGCSKGTYIRTLCHDIGQKLNCGAVMTKLLRTKTGMFEIENTTTLEELQNGVFEKGVYNIEDIFSQYPKIVVVDSVEKLIKNGVKINIDRIDLKDIKEELYAVYNSRNTILMVAVIKDNMLEMVKSFY